LYLPNPQVIATGSTFDRSNFTQFIARIFSDSPLSSGRLGSFLPPEGRERGRMSVIVILDDRATNRKIFAKLAASIEAGAEVHSFGDPADALAWLATHTPDLVVTDYKMPSMDGAEFIRRFRARPQLAEIPVIVITVYEEREFRLQALQAGATDFLHSPVDHQEFITRARNLLKLRHQQQLLEHRAAGLERKLESSEEALRNSSERLAQVIDTVPAMISAADKDGRFLFVNAYQTSLAGLDPTAVVGREVSELFGEDHGARSRALDRKVFRTGKPLPSYEEEIVDRSGTKRVFLTTKSPLRGRANAVIGVLTSSLDITEHKRAEDHLLHMAQHDTLTGLPNRTLLSDLLRREFVLARRGDRPFALHRINLDAFKNVNDALGHGVGDQFLKSVAERLQSLTKDGDAVARLGGDEFAVLQTNATHEEAEQFARQLVAAASQPFVFADERVEVTVSVGVAVHPRDGMDEQEILKNAELAMYQAKGDGGNQFRLFAADMNSRAREALILDSRLREAVAKSQFVLHFQPQVDLRSRRIVGAEALVRWQTPERGIVSPAEFLPRAEKTGLILPINEWVLREACREAASWPRRGLPPLRIGVNLSSVQFQKQSVPLLVARILGDTGLDPRRLDLELTESMLLEQTDEVVRDLQQLRGLGVGISIDDFGTRYSSLTYVKHFPIDRLKIDQSFVRDLGSNPHDAAIVRAVISLGHSLELEVIAEGVESAEQVSLLHAEGCDEVQGYFFGKPMPSSEFVARAASEQKLKRSA
jgi:diguanylate cyclase (GGDEF)-like protein/PAS domain S-box-containing protein